MTIQHRDIPDSQRHEVKGASSALSGTVLVADGLGATNFQPIGVANLGGSVPTTTPNLFLITDGSGGVTAAVSVYARFSLASGVLSADPVNGFNLALDSFTVDTSGFYWVSSENYTLDTDVTPNVLSHGKLINRSTAAVAFNGFSGIVFLDSNFTYGFDTDGTYSLWKIAV